MTLTITVSKKWWFAAAFGAAFIACRVRMLQIDTAATWLAHHALTYQVS